MGVLDFPYLTVVYVFRVSPGFCNPWWFLFCERGVWMRDVWSETPPSSFFTKNLPRLAQNADILGLSVTKKTFKGDLCVSNSYFTDVPFLNVFSRSNAIF